MAFFPDKYALLDFFLMATILIQLLFQDHCLINYIQEYQAYLFITERKPELYCRIDVFSGGRVDILDID